MRTGIERFSILTCALGVFWLTAAGSWPALGQQAPTEKAAATAPAEGAHPIISVDNMVADFGEHWASPKMEHTYRITNTGNAPLEIKSVRPTCGCTIAGDYPKSIAQGETGEFPFTLNVARYQGPYTKAIFIFSNDPEHPQLRLDMKGIARQRIETHPRGAFFGILQGNEELTRIVKITNTTDTPLKLELKPPSNPGLFRFELTETTPGEQYELKVTASPPFQEKGLKRVGVTLTTNLPEEPTKIILVSGNVQPRLSLRPEFIRILTPPPGLTDNARSRLTAAHRVRGLTLVNSGDKPVKITDATIDDPDLSVEYTKVGTTNNYNFRVSWPEGYAVPEGGRTLTIKTDDAEFPEFKVPIQAMARPPSLTPQNPQPRPQQQQPQQQQQQKQQQPKPQHRPLRPVEQMVGKKAPEFSLTTLGDKPVNNEALTGKVTVLNFFAPQCPFSRKQLARLDEIRATYVPRGVRFINVHETMRGSAFTVEQLNEMFEQIESEPGELAMDKDNKVGKLFKANAYPTMVVVGKDGTIAAANVGNIGDLEERLKAQLGALLADKPIPDEYLPPKPGSGNQAAAPAPQRRVRPVEQMVGKKAPEFSLTTLEGKLVNNETSAGNVVVLNFFAPQCPYSRKQVARLDEIRASYVPRGVRFINVHETMRGPAFTVEQLNDMFKEIKSEPGELAMDKDNKVGKLFKATAFPTMVVLGKDGTIAAVNVGNMGNLEERLKAQLDALLADKPIPDEYLPAKPGSGDQAAAPPRRIRPVEQMVGKPAPAFSLTTVKGDALSNQSLSGKITVLNFFAPQCPFCRRQLSRLDKIRATYVPKGVRVINVHETMRGEPFTVEQLNDMFKEIKSEPGELVMDKDNKVGKLFKATAFPTMVVLGKDGAIAAVNVGNMGNLEERLKAQLDALLAGKPIPDDYLPPKPQT